MKPDFQKAAIDYCNSDQALKDWLDAGMIRSAFSSQVLRYTQGAEFGYHSRDKEIEQLRAGSEKLQSDIVDLETEIASWFELSVNKDTEIESLKAEIERLKATS